MKANIYMITCDKTNHVLNVTIPLWNKYWNIPKSVKILGFNKPDVSLPAEYEFISMRPEQLSIDDWCKDIHSVISNDPNEFVIFTLDDFLPINYVNTEILDFYYNELENNPNLVRCALGIDLSFQPHKILRSYENFTTIEQSQTSPYRITTQPSIWRKDYLLHFLNKSTNPWNFETENNPIDGKIILGTIGENAFRYIEESALSGRHPNKINILGMRFDDVRWLLGNGLLDENKLQFGQYVGQVPQFKDYGFKFNLDVLKIYAGEAKYKHYLEKYRKFYESTNN
jgi:hypothetical protein